MEQYIEIISQLQVYDELKHTASNACVLFIAEHVSEFIKYMCIRLIVGYRIFNIRKLGYVREDLGVKGLGPDLSDLYRVQANP